MIIANIMMRAIENKDAFTDEEQKKLFTLLNNILEK
jgi:hypothetical protein